MKLGQRLLSLRVVILLFYGLLTSSWLRMQMLNTEQQTEILTAAWQKDGQHEALLLQQILDRPFKSKDQALVQNAVTRLGVLAGRVEVTIVDSKNTVLARSPGSLTFERYLTTVLSQRVFQSQQLESLNSRFVYLYYYGLPLVNSAGETSAVLVIQRTWEKEYQQIQRQAQVTFWQSLLLAVVVFLLADMLTGAIVLTPVNALVQLTQKVNLGNLSIRIQNLGIIPEIKSLGTEFNNMLDTLKHQESELYLLNQDLENRVQKRTQELQFTLAALQASEERYRAVVEQTIEGICLVDAITGNIIEANSTCLHLLGYTKEDILELKLENLIFLKIDVFEKKIQELLTHKSLSLNELQCVTKNGHLVDVSASISLISYDNREVFCAVFHDITERKQMEDALRQSEARFRAAIEGSLDAFFVFKSRRDKNGHITDFTFADMNSNAEKMISMSKKEVVGRKMCEIIPVNYMRDLFEKYVRVVETRVVLEQEFPVSTPELTAKWLHHQVVPLSDGIAITSRDITERKHAEQALQEANGQLRNWVRELEQRTREITMLNEISEILQACVTVKEAYSALSELIQPLFPTMSGGVFMLSDSQHLAEAIAIWGDPSVFPSQKLFVPNECWALRRGRMHVVNNNQSSLMCKHMHSNRVAESICIPMIAQGETLGTLHLSAFEPGELSPAKQQLAVTIAENLALTLANLKLRSSLQHQSIRDPLTGLFNRRYLEESLQREIHRAERSEQPLGIIMLDVDHFKRFNDTFGHDAGDAVLRELGLFLQKQVRGSDIACRYGGEEMILVLPEANIQTTRERAEAIRKEVKHLNVQHRRQVLGAISLSLGVACFPEHGLTGDAIVQAADTALYRAKREGRDRVVVAS